MNWEANPNGRIMRCTVYANSSGADLHSATLRHPTDLKQVAERLSWRLSCKVNGFLICFKLSFGTGRQTRCSSVSSMPSVIDHLYIYIVAWHAAGSKAPQNAFPGQWPESKWDGAQLGCLCVIQTTNIARLACFYTGVQEEVMQPHLLVPWMYYISHIWLLKWP